eukprot:TRINITY_DN2_c0_g1_i14.p1 TRINITY_DN2_c0_g1~~TRINITY_DN2_c0_g1_i14.p1  ORF type:complete len:119 (-),score=14.44 TRINITY_DN2_c0_g1_i14:63-419(-)
MLDSIVALAKFALKQKFNASGHHVHLLCRVWILVQTYPALLDNHVNTIHTTKTSTAVMLTAMLDIYVLEAQDVWRPLYNVLQSLVLLQCHVNVEGEQLTILIVDQTSDWGKKGENASL